MIVNAIKFDLFKNGKPVMINVFWVDDFGDMQIKRVDYNDTDFSKAMGEVQTVELCKAIEREQLYF
mgnify:CR=1 FL=1|tara:strand:+ start:76877 stop:77074 length:198 start_codon:yes stop_codon:yes gene_type:complete